MAREPRRHHTHAGGPPWRDLCAPARAHTRADRYVIDPDVDPDIDLLIEALEILKAVHRFWIEANIGVFICADGTVMDDVDPEDVKPSQWLMLQTCLRAYIDGLPAQGGA